MKMISISTSFLGASLSLAGLISNSFCPNLPSPGIRRLNLKGTVEVLYNLMVYLLGKL
jgi:hypothetical protein